MAALEGARTFQLVVAATRKMGIGKAGETLPGPCILFTCLKLCRYTPSPQLSHLAVMQALCLGDFLAIWHTSRSSLAGQQTPASKMQL